MLKEYLSDTRKILKLYGLGALLFFIGIGFIQWGANVIEPSLEQELIVLVGLGFGGIGFSIAMAAQCGLIINRFNTMGQRPNQK